MWLRTKEWPNVDHYFLLKNTYNGYLRWDCREIIVYKDSGKVCAQYETTLGDLQRFEVVPKEEVLAILYL